MTLGNVLEILGIAHSISLTIGHDYPDGRVTELTIKWLPSDHKVYIGKDAMQFLTKDMGSYTLNLHCIVRFFDIEHHGADEETDEE